MSRAKRTILEMTIASPSRAPSLSSEVYASWHVRSLPPDQVVNLLRSVEFYQGQELIPP